MESRTQSVSFSYRPSRFIRALTTAGLAAAITFSAAAGGRQEEAPSDSPRTQDPGTRIEIQEPPAESETPRSSQSPQSPAQRRADPELRETDDGTTVAILDRPAWVLGVHPSMDLLQEEVSQTIENGYIPVGMEVEADGTFTILYIVSAGVVPERWFVESYEPAEVNDQISTRLLSGWNPLGFSVLDGTIFVLYGSGGADIGAWRIHQTGLDPEEVQRTIVSYQNDGYAIVDISIDETTDQLWYLFVDGQNRSGGAGSRIFVNAYSIGEQMVNGMSDDYNAGRGIPFGFGVDGAVGMALFVD